MYRLPCVFTYAHHGPTRFGRLHGFTLGVIHTRPTLPPRKQQFHLKAESGERQSGPIQATKPASTTETQGGRGGTSDVPPLLTAYTSLLRCLAVTEWLAGALALLTRWVHSRGAQAGGGGPQAASRWGPILVSGNGRKVLERLMSLHRYTLMEVSRTSRHGMGRLCNE